MLLPLSLWYVNDLEEWNWLHCNREFIIRVFAVHVMVFYSIYMSEMLKAISIQSNENKKIKGLGGLGIAVWTTEHMLCGNF